MPVEVSAKRALLLNDEETEGRDEFRKTDRVRSMNENRDEQSGS